MYRWYRQATAAAERWWAVEMAASVQNEAV